jgi:hypothetical protein
LDIRRGRRRRLSIFVGIQLGLASGSPNGLPAPLHYRESAREPVESCFRIGCGSAFRLQCGDALVLALDKCFDFADLVIQFRKTISVHRVSMCSSDAPRLCRAFKQM